MIPGRIASLGLLGLLGSALLVRDNGLAAPAQPVQTETAPEQPTEEPTRQVRRHRARKGWRDAPGWMLNPARLRTSRYLPHQGKREMARRVRQMAASNG